MKLNNMEPELEIISCPLPSREKGVVVYSDGDGLFMTQKEMAELFACEVNNIVYHLQNIFEEGELEEKSVTQESRVTAADGKKYLTKIYNVDAVLSVGYRADGAMATKWRQWVEGWREEKRAAEMDVSGGENCAARCEVKVAKIREAVEAVFEVAENGD